MSTPVSHAAPAVTTRSIAIPFAAIVLAMLPAVLDQTILATALPTIRARRPISAAAPSRRFTTANVLVM